MVGNLWPRIGFVILILALLFSAFPTPAVPAAGAAHPPADPFQPGSPFALYLPHLPQFTPREMTFIGVEVEDVTSDHLDRARELNTSWVRIAGINWKEIEPVRTDPPTYHWNADREQNFIEISTRGMRAIVTVKFAPEWAQKLPGVSCGPVAEEALDEFAGFMTAVVARYSQPPYNVKYWELGNEPDVAQEQVNEPDNIFGCWGDMSDPYFGGGYYAEMLKQVYPAIKAADPEAQVLNGGLLLDCDPTNPPEGTECRPGNFLEGILENGGGDYFDILSFHGYAPYYFDFDTDREFPSWKHRGGVVMGKIDFIRTVMAKYGVDKPLIQTEGGLHCPEWNPTQCDPPVEAFFEAQADYAVRLFARNRAAGVLGTVWYTLDGPGWRHGSLTYRKNNRPAFLALNVLGDRIGSAAYARPVTEIPGLTGYEFIERGRRQWVLWPEGKEPQTITLPANVRRVYDRFNRPVGTRRSQITVKGPVYIEFQP